MSVVTERNDNQDRALSSVEVPDDGHIEGTLRFLGGLVKHHVPAPPIGFDLGDITQSYVLGQLESLDMITKQRYGDTLNRIVDIVSSMAAQATPGNTAYRKALDNLYNGIPLKATSRLIGQAAQRRAVHNYRGKQVGSPSEVCDELGISRSDTAHQSYEAAEERASSLIPELVNNCPVSTTDKNASRNQEIIVLYLNGYTFREIEKETGVNYKTATAIFRRFVIWSRAHLNGSGLSEEMIRGIIE